MSNLTGVTIESSYGGVINIGPSGADGTLRTLTDGFGNNLPVQMSTSGVNFTGSVSGIGPKIKNIEIENADLSFQEGDTIINVTFDSPFTSPNYSIFFNFALDPENIGSGNDFWLSQGSPSYLIAYDNKTVNGFTIIIPTVDLTSYNNFLGYITCISLGES